MLLTHDVNQMGGYRYYLSISARQLQRSLDVRARNGSREDRRCAGDSLHQRVQRSTKSGERAGLRQHEPYACAVALISRVWLAHCHVDFKPSGVSGGPNGEDQVGLGIRRRFAWLNPPGAKTCFTFERDVEAVERLQERIGVGTQEPDRGVA